jgi:hypothetical protein
MTSIVLKNSGDNPISLDWEDWHLELQPGEISYPISETMASRFLKRIKNLSIYDSNLDSDETKNIEEIEPVKKRRKRGES